MQTNRLILISSALTALAAPTYAADKTDTLPFRYTLRSDWTINKYGKDTRNCWNNGVAADCSQTPTELEGETEGRIMYDRDINDNWTFRSQVGLGAYYNTGWYEHSLRSLESTPASGARPLWVTKLVDTWIGFQHEDYGTVRIGTGLNPYQEAAGATQLKELLGGQELLERMVAYDSPLLFGDMSMTVALYDGTRLRKAKYELADEDNSSASHTRGISLVLKGKIASKFTTKFGFYNETTGAREFYGVGPLDGSYTGSAGSEDKAALTSYIGDGTRVTSRGVALDVSYNAGAYTVGGAVAFARRLRNDSMTNFNFSTNGFGTGYATDAVSVYFSTWRGQWSFWSSVGYASARLTDTNLLTSSSDWLYSNSTYNFTSIQGEASYALHPHANWVIGAEIKGYDFKESPNASGMCQQGGSHPCYDPSGIKIYTGIRSKF